MIAQKSVFYNQIRGISFIFYSNSSHARPAAVYFQFVKPRERNKRQPSNDFFCVIKVNFREFSRYSATDASLRGSIYRRTVYPARLHIFDKFHHLSSRTEHRYTKRHSFSPLLALYADIFNIYLTKTAIRRKFVVFDSELRRTEIYDLFRQCRNRRL